MRCSLRLGSVPTLRPPPPTTAAARQGVARAARTVAGNAPGRQGSPAPGAHRRSPRAPRMPRPRSSAPRTRPVRARDTSTCSSTSRQPIGGGARHAHPAAEIGSSRLRGDSSALKGIRRCVGHCAAGPHQGQCERLRRRRSALRSGISAHNQALRCRGCQAQFCLAGRRRGPWWRSTPSRSPLGRPVAHRSRRCAGTGARLSRSGRPSSDARWPPRRPA
jgi:hypothetical protein